MGNSTKNIIKVGEFVDLVNGRLKLMGDFVVEGELSEVDCRKPWLYLKLKDENTIVKVWGSMYKIQNWEMLKEGLLVHVYGNPSVFNKTGQFQISAWQILPAGEGALKLAFEQLKKKLEDGGFFRVDRKRPIPQFPQRIGLITAKDSQAYKDVTKVLRERMGGLFIYFYPVTVQGKGAVESIIHAFSFFNQTMPDLDAIIICRGGGSLEDLQAFNDERVVRAIYGSVAPVVSGIGHEGNITLTDLVADLRASTPSNAAELLVNSREEVLQTISYCERAMENSIHNLFTISDRITHYQSKLEFIIQQMLERQYFEVNTLVDKLKEKMDQEFSYVYKVTGEFADLGYKFETKITVYAHHIDNRRNDLVRLMETMVSKTSERIISIERLLDAFNFEKVLMRGFSITRGRSGKIIRSIAEVLNGDEVTTVIQNGRILSTVKAVTQK